MYANEQYLYSMFTLASLTQRTNEIIFFFCIAVRSTSLIERECVCVSLYSSCIVNECCLITILLFLCVLVLLLPFAAIYVILEL